MEVGGMSTEGVLGPLPRFLSWTEMLSGMTDPAREDATVEACPTPCLAPLPLPLPVPEIETPERFGSERPATDRLSPAMA